MSITLKYEDLARVLTDIKQNPNDENKKLEFVNVVNPIIKLTIDKFPQDMHEDMAQEMKIFLMKRAEYIANAFFSEKILNPTNYMFRVCRNSATNYFKKEAKSATHLVPIDDIKIEPIYTPKTAEKSKILDEIREQCLDFIRLRYTRKVDQKIAERFLVALLQGKRPSFYTQAIRKFAKSRQENAKDIYSVVLLKMRELITPRIEDLTE